MIDYKDCNSGQGNLGLIALLIAATIVAMALILPFVLGVVIHG